MEAACARGTERTNEFILQEQKNAPHAAVQAAFRIVRWGWFRESTRAFPNRRLPPIPDFFRSFPAGKLRGTIAVGNLPVNGKMIAKSLIVLGMTLHCSNKCTALRGCVSRWFGSRERVAATYRDM